MLMIRAHILKNASLWRLLLFFLLLPNLRFSHRLCDKIACGAPQSLEFPYGDLVLGLHKVPKVINTHTHAHTQTCKHRQTGSSHCSSFVYTSQHLSYVLYTFGKRGPFSNWGPYCSFCYKSPVWMPKQTHTHTGPTPIRFVDKACCFRPLGVYGHRVWGTSNYRTMVPHKEIQWNNGTPQGKLYRLATLCHKREDNQVPHKCHV